METLNVQVRKSPDFVEIFFYDENKGLNCFSFKEGHNMSGQFYRLNTCKPVTLEVAQIEVGKMQKYYDSLPVEKIKLRLVQRLTKR